MNSQFIARILSKMSTYFFLKIPDTLDFKINFKNRQKIWEFKDDFQNKCVFFSVGVELTLIFTHQFCCAMPG